MKKNQKDKNQEIASNTSRRTFLGFCVKTMKCLFLSSILGFFNYPFTSQSQEISKPSPPGSTENSVKFNPDTSINETDIKKRISKYIDSLIKGFEAEGRRFTEQEKEHIKRSLYKDIENMLKKKGYDLIPPAPPMDLRILD